METDTSFGVLGAELQYMRTAGIVSGLDENEYRMFSDYDLPLTPSYGSHLIVGLRKERRIELGPDQEHQLPKMEVDRRRLKIGGARRRSGLSWKVRSTRHRQHH